MAYVKVHEVGDYSVLRLRDVFFVSVYDAETKKTFVRSLHTRDFATVIAAVQSLVDRRGGAVGAVR
jgi:hypothetical protein